MKFLRLVPSIYGGEIYVKADSILKVYPCYSKEFPTEIVMVGDVKVWAVETPEEIMDLLNAEVINSLRMLNK